MLLTCWSLLIVYVVLPRKDDKKGTVRLTVCDDIGDEDPRPIDKGS